MKKLEDLVKLEETELPEELQQNTLITNINNKGHEYIVNHGFGDTKINFQVGGRNEPDMIPGVIDLDLINILLDRTKYFLDAYSWNDEENLRTYNGLVEVRNSLTDRIKARAEKGVLGNDGSDYEINKK